MKVIHPKGFDSAAFDSKYGWISNLLLIGTLAFVAYNMYRGNGTPTEIDEDDW